MRSLILWLTFIVSLSYPSAHAAADTPYSLTQYVQDCESQGISVPEELNCDSGTELQVFKTVTDPKTGAAKKIPITDANFDSVVGDGTCDAPALVQQYNPSVGCMPGAKVQIIKPKKDDAVCAFICRRTDLRTPKGFFQDLSLICHNPRNGATCFFNSKVNLDQNQAKPLAHSGVRIPKPGSSPGAKTWMEPKELTVSACASCHDASPFIVTPNLGGFGETLRAASGTDVFGKYFVVSKGAPFDQPIWSQRMFLNESNSCASCHRIGSGVNGGCGYLRNAAVGQVKEFQPISEFFRKGFMPPEGHDALKDYEADLKRIALCCDDFDKAGRLKQPQTHQCSWQPIASGL